MINRKTPVGGVRVTTCLVVSIWCATFLMGGAASARDCLDYALYGGTLGDAPLFGGLVLDAEAVDVSLQAGHAYLACGDDGLHIVELSNPQIPVRVGIADLLGDVACVAVWGEYAVTGVGSVLKLVDVTAAADPQWVHTLNAGGPVRDVSLLPPLALAVAETGGLSIVDLEASPVPAKLGSVVPTAEAYAAAGAGSTVWLATDAGLETVSIADPTAPSLTGLPLGGAALRALVLDGATLWAATADGRLIVFDVGDPEHPAVYRDHALPAAATSLRLDAGFLAWTGADGLTRMAGVGPRGVYVPLGSLPTPGHAHVVDGFGPYLVLADGNGGIQVGWHQCDLILAAGRDREPRARLLSNVPNPLNPGTTVIFSVTASTRVRLTLHDARGRAVAVLLDEVCEAGAHEAVWDGRLEDGRRAPSGVWHVRLEAGDRFDTKSLVVLR